MKPLKRRKISRCNDDREQALEYYKYANGIYKRNSDDCDKLVGHAPTEI